jgi:fructose-1,6-bisphosphatase I
MCRNRFKKLNKNLKSKYARIPILLCASFRFKCQHTLTTVLNFIKIIFVPSHMRITTLDEFILQSQKEYPQATGELSGLLRDLGLAAKIISREVNRAGLADILGSLGGGINPSGEEVQKLDILADKVLQSCLQTSGECCGIASEENQTFIPITEAPDAKYVVLFDPLDGSSNIDVNVSIGTIFGIYKRVSQDDNLCTLADFLQSGAEQVAAGYMLYGSSTMFVYSTGNGVNGFTLDISIGEFCLSHPDMRIPKGRTYSVNAGKQHNFEPAVQQFIQECVIERDMEFRYIGSMVADVHRTLIKGGIFMYPALPKSPKGKLRLMYECNPLAFIMEQAGGAASNGYQRILELDATELHQRTPIFIGNTELVERLEQILLKEKDKQTLRQRG